MPPAVCDRTTLLNFEHVWMIVAANNVTDIIAGKPHPLLGDRAGQFSISLAGGTRLVIQPHRETVPRKSDGSVDWVAVTAIAVCYIGDYHD